MKLVEDYTHIVSLPPGFEISSYDRERLDLTTNLLGKSTVHILNWKKTMETTEVVYKGALDAEFDELKEKLTTNKLTTTDLNNTRNLLQKLTEYERTQID